jgi:hypothetical protein
LRANADGRAGLLIGRDHILRLDPGDSANKIKLDNWLAALRILPEKGMEIFD